MLNRIVLIGAASLVSLASTCYADESPFVSVNEYCQAVVSNPTMQRYAKLAKDGGEVKGDGGYATSSLQELFEAHSLVSDWVNQKLTAAFGAQGNAQLAAYMAEVKKTCGKALVDSEMTFFDPNKYRSGMSGVEIDIGGEKQYFNYLEGKRDYFELQDCKANKVKKIADDGSIQMSEPECTKETQRYYAAATESLILPAVLAFKNGDKVLQGASQESLATLEAQVGQMQANQNKWNAEQVAEKKRNDEQRAAQVAKDNARIARVNQMRSSGNYAVAENCYEVVEALGAETLTSYNPLLKADNRYYSMAAKLDHLDGGKGFIQNADTGAFAAINITTNTLWRTKEKIQQRGMVTVVGKYVANGSVSLTDGSAQPTRIYEVVCIQPYSALLGR